MTAKKSSQKNAAYEYKLLARFYDQLFDVHHDWYKDARQSVLGNILPNVNSACDLACGTGTTAVELAALGMKVFAVDLSPTMCRITRQKAVLAGLDVNVICADIRAFRLPEPVDLVICEFDGLNHVPRKTDLPCVLSAAARALHPGGYLYFDVNERKAFETLWPGTWTFEKDHILTTISGGYDDRRDRGWTRLEWHLQDSTPARTYREQIRQVCWDRSQVRRSLNAAGFVDIQSHDGTEFAVRDPRIQKGCRTFYLAQKSR